MSMLQETLLFTSPETMSWLSSVVWGALYHNEVVTPHPGEYLGHCFITPPTKNVQGHMGATHAHRMAVVRRNQRTHILSHLYMTFNRISIFGFRAACFPTSGCRRGKIPSFLWLQTKCLDPEGEDTTIHMHKYTCIYTYTHIICVYIYKIYVYVYLYIKYI